jgi:hypothetical protein
MDGERINRATSRGQFEEFFNELNLTANIIPVDPPNLARPDHVDRFIALNRSPCRLELSERQCCNLQAQTDYCTPHRVQAAKSKRW